MRYSLKIAAAFATAAAVVAATALPASAECKSYAFEVNDYGKDGPTKDAKDLLDKLIASKMSEKGVKDFHTGKKTVSCYMFLNFILFDEYTCSAEAKVCWGGTPLPASEEASGTDDNAAPPTTKAATDESAAPKVAKKKKKEGSETAKAADPTAPAEAPVAAVKDPKSALVQKAETEAKAKKKHEASAEAAGDSAAKTSSDGAEKSASTTPAKPAAADAKPVETGSLTDTEKKTAAKPKAEKKISADDATVAPVKVKAKASDDAGYPTPVGPGPQDTPNP